MSFIMLYARSAVIHGMTDFSKKKQKTVTQRKELHPIIWMNHHANLTQAMKHRYNIIIGSS